MNLIVSFLLVCVLMLLHLQYSVQATSELPEEISETTESGTETTTRKLFTSITDTSALCDFFNTVSNKSPLDTWQCSSSNNAVACVGGQSSWEGVACTRSTNRVKSLNLSGLNLQSASLPTTIGGLRRLTELVITSSSLSGTLPKQLGSITRLRTLDLSSNNLTGKLKRRLGRCVKLQTLALTGNKLTGSVPSELSSLSAITLLDISSNKFANSVPKQLGSLTTLRVLNLNDNSFAGQGR